MAKAKENALSVQIQIISSENIQNYQDIIIKRRLLDDLGVIATKMKRRRQRMKSVLCLKLPMRREFPQRNGDPTAKSLHCYDKETANSNNDDLSSDDESFEDIEYVDASIPDPAIVNVVLHEKLLSITRLYSNIESLNDNSTLDRVLNSFESDNSLLDNFSPEFKTFCDHSEETRSGNTTHANYSLPEYDSFCFEIEPGQERLINLMKNDISDSSNDPLLEEADLFLSDDLIPSGIENVADDPEGDIRFLEELLIDDSILSHESSDPNNPLIPRPPSEPPDVESFFDLKPDMIAEEISDKLNEDKYPVVVGDTKGAVFGGLVEAPLRPSTKKRYQGSNNTFVFTNASGPPVIFRPTGANRYFTLCSTEYLALGGGSHFALYLDSDLLNGSSLASETYGNSCLSHTQEFGVKEIELWGFVYASEYEETISMLRTEAPGICRWSYMLSPRVALVIKRRDSTTEVTSLDTTRGWLWD
nr:hypothetical protein [Tanacetum cinerariifolium]